MVSSHGEKTVADTSYAPYSINRDFASLGLSRQIVESAFGKIQVFVTNHQGGHGTLFLHGVGGAWSSWSPLIQAARDANIDLGQCAFLDLPGFGDSENLTGSLPADLVSRELFALAATLGWDSITLVGHSMGGFLALHAASMDREPAATPSLRSLVIVSGTYISVVETVQRGWRAWYTNTGVAATFEVMRMLARLGPGAPALLEALRRTRLLPLGLSRTLAHPERVDGSFYVELVNGLRPRSFLQAAENGRIYDVLARWSRINLPVLLISGVDDHLVPVGDVQRAQGVIRESSVVLLQECGHFAPLEHPTILASLVAARISG